jgi:alanyl aminopeptidase
LPPAVVLAALPDLIALGDRKLLESTMGVVGSLDTHLVPDDLRPNYERVIRTLYGSEAARLGLASAVGESEDVRLLRPGLVGLVALTGKEGALTQAALPLADRWLGDRTGVDPEMVDTVLAMAAQHGDRALFDRMHAEAAKETDRERRNQILGAMSAFADPTVAVAGMDLALTGEFDLREAYNLVFGPLNRRETREVAWAWTKVHVDALAAALPVYARGYLPYAGSVFCDAGHRDQVEALFRPRVKDWLGGTRNLAQAEESISVCEEGVRKQAAGIRAFLAGY